MLDNRKVILDEAMLMADTGSADTAGDSAATVDGVAKVHDSGGGYMEGKLVIDIDTLTGAGVTASNGSISITLEGSTTSTFTTFVRLARLQIASVTASADTRDMSDAGTYATASTGRYIIPFTNDFHGTVFRWLRLYNVYNGTCDATNNGIKYKAWLTKK